MLPNVKIAFGIVGTIVDGVAKAKRMEPKLPDWLIEGIEKMQRLSSFSHAWTHVV